MDPRYYKILNDTFRTNLDESNTAIEETLESIIELDGSKAPYDDIILSLDADIFNEVGNVNSKIIDVASAYQDRINVGCRTDVFWRVTGVAGTVYTLVATKLSLAGYAGTLPTVEYFDGSTITSYDNFDIFGFDSEPAYGIKYYDEPLTEDLEDTFVTSFTGIIESGSSELITLSPVGSSSTIGISTSSGQLVISSKQDVLPSSSNIIGIGTTTLSRSILGISTETPVTTLTLDSIAIGDASAPESDGSYVTFTVLSSVSDLNIEYYDLLSEKDPSIPQIIGIITSGNLGIGVSIQYDNSGFEPNVIAWNPDAFDPDAFDEENPTVTTSEPEVGAGNFYFPVGFSSYPITLSGERVSVGFVTTVNISQIAGILSSTSPCPTQETNLTNAINTLNIAKSDIASGISTLNYKIDVSNTFREQRKEIQSEIWTLRQQIAEFRADIIKFDKALNFLGVSTVTDIILETP
jgi:hypothetical protein